MAKWITNWRGDGKAGAVGTDEEKWGVCSAAMAAQISADRSALVMLVDDGVKVGRLILRTPDWAQTLAQRSPAVALALRLSPLDRRRSACQNRQARAA